MKHSFSSLFNNSQKIKNKNFNIKYGLNNSNIKILNNSTIGLKFPKIIIKTRNERISNIKIHENKTQNRDSTNSCYNTINSLKDSFKILNLTKKNNSTIFLNRNNNKNLIYNLRYNKENNNLTNEKDNNTATLKSLSSIYNNYHTIFNKTNTDYDSIFLNKSKMTNYKKWLSSDYEKDNKSVIDIFGTKYKQKTDSILNVVQNKDGFYIKGLIYKKYFFFPHKKLNILAFHHNIMSKNIKKFEKKKKVENMKRIKHVEKLCKRNKEIIDDTSINNNKNINNIYNIIKRKKLLKKKLKKKKNISSQEIEDIINEEYNNAINSIDK